ncbi:MAG: FIST C-terminal domain-containing protein [Methylomonas sp.]|uniref:FIST signal transduction protein n=1 Tax=Methylomonas sp. TaxID=418 RepID=UPI0025D6D348|nr:FIST C-terminal domain-containing protein [Methylomonas sp.]MCK9604875.1 FIST C-terminal domain-containing protein [Methylomonas sp.]
MIYFSSIDKLKIEALLLNWRTEFPNMGVLAMVPEAEKSQVLKLQALCRRHQIPLCGAIFPQLIYGNEFHCSGICLLRFDIMPYVALHTGVLDDTLASAQAIALGVSPELIDDIPATLFLLLDGLLPHISTLLDELYLRLANRVHYAGVNAGSESFQAMPCLFDSYRLVGNAVLVILLKPHRGAVLEHGYQTQAQSLHATSTDGNRIIHIDWRPAFEVYQELVRAEFGVDITRENFYSYAVHFPFGILRANHCTLVRIPVMLDEDNALFCIGEVPAHSMLTLLAAPRVDSVNTVETLQQGLTELRGNPEANGVLLFYCAGRRQHMGQAAAVEELRLFSEVTRPAAVAGALALGEIGKSTLWGYPLFQNATLVTADWEIGQ